MTVHYLPSPEGMADPSADETARELVFLAGRDALLLPDDDEYDAYAVELAECGVRRVRLTLAERLTAATRLLSGGATVRTVCTRLGLPEDTEEKWRQLCRRGTAAIAVLAILGAAAFAVMSTGRNETVRQRAHHMVSTLHRTDRDKGRRPADRDRDRGDRI